MNHINLVEPYNPLWKVAFNRLQNKLALALEGFETNIQHVGSTAVPGLCAKPVLDVDIILKEKAHFAGVAAALSKMGYINKGEQGIAGRFAFRQHYSLLPATPPIKEGFKHHVYVCFHDSLALKNHLVFRNELLRNPHLVTEYARLKMQLTTTPGITRAQYNYQKTGFILMVLKQGGLTDAEISVIQSANEL